MFSLTQATAELRGGAPVGVSGIDAASIERPPSAGLSHNGGGPRGRRVARRPAVRRQVNGSGGALRLEDLVEHQLAGLDLVRSVVGERGVAVLVDRVLAEDRVAVLDLEELIDDGLAVGALATGGLNR